ncbi:Alpha/beta hydrolase fold-1 [Trinorchestia longiramus]|nr:Alpha/beta hydrolase fold-1 [Trinorchestia longiramus]
MISRLKQSISKLATAPYCQKSSIPSKYFFSAGNTNLFSSLASTSAAKEFSLKTPTGHIAGKVWNEEAPVAVLCLHGLLDNAGSFDRLVPLLPDHLCCVAIDLPGHGWSSHNPPGTSRPVLHYVIPVGRVIRHFGWKQVIMIGHSMGGVIGMFYAGTKPAAVHSLITIDLVKPIHCHPNDMPQSTAKSLDNLFLNEHQLLHTKRPSYTYDDLLEHALEGHNGNLDKTQIKVLMQRGAEKLPDGRYSFTHSLNEKLPRIVSLSLEQVLAFTACLHCRMMIFKAKDGPIYEDQKYVDAAIEVYRQASTEFEYHSIPGDHHVHLSRPETLMPYIARFLSLDAVPCNNIGDNGGSLVTKGLLNTNELCSHL